MNKIVIATACSVMACNTYAFNGTVNNGSAMTLGPSSLSASLSSATFNPGMNSLVIGEGDSMRLSYFPTIGANYEVGALDNFADDIEELADIIDDSSNTDDDVSVVLDRFNKVLKLAGEDGYIKFNANINAPLLPLYFYSESLKGTIGFDYSVNLQVGLSLLNAELTYNNQNNSFATASALYLKSGIQQTYSVSYGREVLTNRSGKLYAGAKLKYIHMELSKQVLPLIELAGEKISDFIEDEYDQNKLSSGNLGLDLGIVWDANSYRIGLTLENINSPTFDYGEIGVNCTDIAENTSSRNSCESAKYFTQTTGEISANEVHKKQAIMRADALVNISDSVQFTTAIDLSKYDDIVGDDNQWLHSAIIYNSNGYILPSARVGYHKNLSGFKTSSITAGITLFEIVSLDFEYGLESVKVDGTSAPRRAGFSLSIQEQF